MRFAHLVAAWLAVAALARPAGPGVREHCAREWTSLDTALGRGSLKVPLKGTWCATRGRLTLLGFLGRYRGGHPGAHGEAGARPAHRHPTPRRPRSPGSTIAFRLANQSNLFTLSSDSGAVAITSVEDGELAGRFVGWFSRAGRGPVVLTGRFSGVTAAPDSVRCETDVPPAPVPTPAPDSGVS